MTTTTAPKPDYVAYVGKYIGVGTDNNQNSSFIELKADGTYVQKHNQCEIFNEINGIYTINGNTLLLNNPDWGTTSNFTIDGDQLIIYSTTNVDGETLATEENFMFDCSGVTVFKK